MDEFEESFFMSRGAREPAERFTRLAAAIRDEMADLDLLTQEADSALRQFTGKEPASSSNGRVSVPLSSGYRPCGRL